MQRYPIIWMVENDSEQRIQLQRELQNHAFDTRTFSHSRDIERRLARERPDLLLIERILDNEDGLELCRRIRRSGDDIPIIMLTIMNEPCDRITGLDCGADDYLGKPYVIGELVARIHARLRGRRMLPAAAPIANADDILFGDCRLDLATRTLIRADRTIELTSGEFAVLTTLANNAHRSLTRERLLELVHHSDTDASERSIDVQISRLRRLVEINPSKPRHIQTVWGYGYVFVPNA